MAKALKAKKKRAAARPAAARPAAKPTKPTKPTKTTKTTKPTRPTRPTKPTKQAAAAKKKRKGAVKLFRFEAPTPKAPRPHAPHLLAWPCEGRLPNRCASVARRVAPPLEVAWRVRLSGPSATAPVVSGDGVAYVADTDGRLHALDVLGGHPLFTSSTDAIRESSPVWPLVAQGLVPRDRVPVSSAPVVFEWHLLFGDDEGLFYCLRRGEAEVIWRKSAPLGMAARQGGAYRAPFVTGETLVTVDAEGNLYAGSARNGTTRFKRYLRGEPASAPALAYPRVIVATTPIYKGEPSMLHALEVDTGERSWTRELPGPPCDALTTTRDVVVVGGAFGLRAFGLEDGAPAWNADLPPVTGPLAHDGRTLTAPVEGGGLVAVDVATGARRWTGSGRGGAPVLAGTGPTLAGDVVWTASEGGLVAWDLTSGKALGRVRVPDIVRRPVVAGDGHVIVATRRGEVICLRPGEAPAP